MSSGADAAAVSSEWRGQSDQPRSTGVAQASGFVRRTAIKLSGRVNELTDGRVCAVDAATGAEIGPYRESRLRQIAVTKRHRGTDGRRCHRQPDRGHYEFHHSKFD